MISIRGVNGTCGTIESFSETFSYGELTTANFRHLALGDSPTENTFRIKVNSSALSAYIVFYLPEYNIGVIYI